MRAQLAPLRQEVQRLERELDTLAKERTALEAQLADASIYEPAAAARLRAALAGQAELARRTGGAEEAWLMASERLEAATSAAANVTD